MSALPKSIKDAQEQVRRALCELDSTGALGFENFMASALSEFTGQDFLVAKSGHQYGTDVRSVPHNFFRVGLEGKRYAQSTKLPVDQLLYKIADASSVPVPVDVWILAATRSVSVSDRERMHEFGECHGIGVVVFDWPDCLAELCDFAAICASVQTTIATYANRTEALETAILTIRESAGFEQVRSRVLERLARADIGYQNARVASQHWMQAAQASLAYSRSRLGGHHNLGQSEFGVVPRARVQEQLDDWYRSDSAVAALLGDEGMGKSWAALDWNNRLNCAQAGAPLTVYLSARTVDHSDVRQTLAGALSKQTGVSGKAFWERRLALWESRASDCVRILVLLDGLNENFNFSAWTDWLQPLFEDHLSGMYRVLLSCWPNWWNAELSNLANLTPSPREVAVDGFTDTELGALLAAMGVERSDFTPDVLKLMRIPRLSSLVVKHRDTLKDSGDVTAERVIYEDWKDRCTRRGTTTGLSDPEMKEFVAELGNKLKDDIDRPITRKEVIRSLSRDSGKTSLELKPAIAELGSGAWLKPGGKPNTFRVSKARIPFVLGATLVAEVEGKTEVAAIEGTIAEFLDPLKEHRIGAAILRAAMTIALVQPDIALAVRKTFLSRWLSERNFRMDDFEAFWRLAGLDPELFLDFSEQYWLCRSGNSFSDEVLIEALSKAADIKSFRPALTRRLACWLGTAWPDPRVGAGLGKPYGTASAKRADNTRARYKQWRSGPVAEQFPTVVLGDGDGWTWLSHRALAILSHLKRASFRSGFEAWALSRAVMEDDRHFDQVAWLLRLNPGDWEQTAAAVRDSILHLESTKDPIARLGAKYLGSAMSRVEWEETPVAIGESGEESYLSVEPTSLDDTELHKTVRRYLSWTAFDRYDPASGTALVEEIFARGFDTANDSLEFVLDNLPELVVLLSAVNRGRLREAIESELGRTKPGGDGGSPDERGLQPGRFLLDLYDAEPSRQSTLVLGSDIGWPLDRVLPFCTVLSRDDILHTDVSNVSAGRLANWLGYVRERLSVDEISELEWLHDLVIHEDSAVRLAAITLAADSRHLPALKAYMGSPYVSPADEDDFGTRRRKDYCRNRAVLELCEYSPDAAARARLSAEHTALIAENRPHDPGVQEKFNRYIRRECESLTSGEPSSSPRYWFSHREAVETLVDNDPDAVLGWLVPWLDDCERLSGMALLDLFPVMDLMEALAAKAPEVSIRIYETLIDASAKTLASCDGISMFPFEIAPIKQTVDLCDNLLKGAFADRVLLEIVVAAHKNNRIDWLLQKIEQLYRGIAPVDVAKAYTLLGMCDATEEADTLWDRVLGNRPVDDWLNRVLQQSLHDYENNHKARSKLREFMTLEEPCAMRHALRRLSGNCDMRCELWIAIENSRLRESSYRHRVLFSLFVPALNKRIKQDRERRKKKLYHTPHAFRMMAPWN